MASHFQLFVVIVACLQSAKEVQGSSNTTASEIHSSTDPSVTIAYPTDESSSTEADAAVPYACPSTITERHSCNGGCSEYTWKRTRYCQCDPLCVEYGDCCPDYADVCGRESDYESWTNDEDVVGSENADTNTSIVPTAVGSTGAMATEDPEVTSVEGSKGEADSSPPGAEYTECIQTTEFDPDGHRPRSGHRLVAVCPHDWSGDPGIRGLCQKPPVSDGLAAIPVEGTAGRHYKNIYCAMCHGVPHANVTFWSVSYQEKERGNIGLLNASLMLQMAKGKTASKAFTTSLNPPGYTDGWPPPSPNLAASSLRSCVILDPTPCPISGAVTQSLCRLHFAPMASNGTTYRNLACLRCDNQPAPSEIVLEEWCLSLGPPRIERGGFLSMATLLIFSDHADVVGLSGEDSAGRSSCWEGQIYDPFLEVCRDMTCPDGFVLEDGVKCARIRAEHASADPQTSVVVALTVAGSLHEGDTPSPYKSDEIWRAIARQAVEDYLSTISVCKISQDAESMRQMDEGSQFCEESHLTWACSMGVAILNSAEACMSGSVFSCSVNMSLETPSTFQSVADSEMFPAKCFLGSLWNFTIRPDYFAMSSPCGIISNETRSAKNGSHIGLALTSKVAYVWDDRSGHLKLSQNDSCMEKNVDCPLLTFSQDDYVITGALNDSIRLTLYDRVLRSGEFNLKDNGEVEVCNFLQGNTPGELWDQAHFILTVTGSSLSLIGLVVTAATYVAFPPLRRNAAGKSLMSLVAALFFAQLTMLVGLNRTEVIAVCIAFAIGSHFLWLAAFFWMNILAVDIYRTFGVGTRLGDPNSRSFSRYALYGWGAPTLIVCTCVVLSFCECVEVDIHYGSKHACWVGNGTANMVSFGLPVVVILCSNAVLFSLTVAGVRKTRMTSKRMNITQGQNNSAARRPNAELILYLKLTAIMGFTWVFGFVASFSGIQFFWYPFIVLNSLQGALVCLAFVGNKRVVGMWRARLKGRRGRYLADSDTSSTRQLHRSYQTSTTELTPAENSTKMTNV